MHPIPRNNGGSFFSFCFFHVCISQWHYLRLEALSLGTSIRLNAVFYYLRFYLRGTSICLNVIMYDSGLYLGELPYVSMPTLAEVFNAITLCLGTFSIFQLFLGSFETTFIVPK